MAEKQVIWSTLAQDELQQILEFYIQRNGNSLFSTKLFLAIDKLVNQLPENNFLGRLSDNGFTRVIVKKEFLIFYEVYQEAILIVSVWGSRQDPLKRIDK